MKRVLMGVKTRTEQIREVLNGIAGYEMVPLRENLVPVKLSELEKAMQEDEDLKKLLTTKAKDFPKDSEYLYLIEEYGQGEDLDVGQSQGLPPGLAEKTLLDLIKDSLNRRKFLSYFSKTPQGKIAGFVGCVLGGDEISEIKMFSFKNSNGIIFLKDLDALIAKFLQEGFTKIAWTAREDAVLNNRIYKKAIEKYNGNFAPLKREKGIRYWIDSESVSPDLYK